MPSLMTEAWAIVGMMVPYMLQMYMMQFVNRITLAFVGTYDDAPVNVAAAALGSMYASVTGLSVGIGITLAVSAYCAQNHGRGADTENGVVFWHCITAHLICFLFSFGVAVFSAPLLGALGQPPSLLDPVRRFTVVMSLSLPATWMFSLFSSVLASQKLQFHTTVAQGIASVINFALAWLLLANGIGFMGIAYANLISAWVGLSYIAAYVIKTGRQSTVWQVPKQLSLIGQVSFSMYIKVAIPIAFTMWAEWWAAEVLAIFAGMLPGREVSVAANGILFNTLAIFYMTFVAVSRACSMRMGHHLGAQDAAGMQMAVALSVTITLMLSCLVFILLNVCGPEILSVYTQDEGILTEAISANPAMAFCVVPYSVLMCLSGALRSASLQGWTAKAFFVSFYLAGIPVGYFLGLVADMGLLGIWLGNILSLSLAALALSVKTANIQWQQVVDSTRRDSTIDQSGDAIMTPLLPTVSRTVSVEGMALSGTPTSWSCSGEVDILY
eukprot:TRINITY_DN75294_c0_g1_i1.p1 TRINITY_DN75294_c0_g1~~TRINITY_DN75294_c0_g1_i1.p1  ORF type:complete len:498 (-),score=72.80 TRINITY_DN75294_c0_g1_i1:288-1781(-)